MWWSTFNYSPKGVFYQRSPEQINRLAISVIHRFTWEVLYEWLRLKNSHWGWFLTSTFLCFYILVNTHSHTHTFGYAQTHTKTCNKHFIYIHPYIGAHTIQNMHSSTHAPCAKKKIVKLRKKRKTIKSLNTWQPGRHTSFQEMLQGNMSVTKCPWQGHVLAVQLLCPRASQQMLWGKT